MPGVSKKQVVAARIGRAIQRGEVKPKKGTASAAMAKMPAKSLHDFAKTSTKGLPVQKKPANPHSNGHSGPHKHPPVPGIYYPGEEIKVKHQTDTVRTPYTRTGTTIEREPLFPGGPVVREVSVDDRFTPGWDKRPGSAAASHRVAERLEEGQRKVPIGGKGLILGVHRRQ